MSPAGWTRVGRVDSLFVYPVKGLSPQRLQAARVTPEAGFPFDRAFALAKRRGEYRRTRDRPLDSHEFHILTAEPRLAAVDTEFDPATGRFAVRVRGHVVLDVDLTSENGREAVAELFGRVLDLDPDEQPVLAHADGFNFSDVGTLPGLGPRICHIINLASVRAFARRVEVAVDPLRFRANLHLDLHEPWVEREWIGRELRIGEVGLTLVKRSERCAATEVNRATARRDLPVPRLLHEHLGHTDFGVYARITSPGSLQAGAEVEVKDADG